MTAVPESCRRRSRYRPLAILLFAIGPAVGFAASTAGKALAKPPSGTAADTHGTQQMELGTTTITEHQGLPRVLYIVPWRRSEAGDLPGRPAGSLLDEALAPIDRAEFRRELRYDQALATPAAPARAAAAQPTTQTQQPSTGD